MKYNLCLFVLIFSGVVFAQSRPKVSSQAQECYREKLEVEKKLKDDPSQKTELSELCKSLLFAARINSEQLLSEPEEKTTVSGARITCSKPAGYTLDFESCTKVMSRYNQVVVLEQLMFAQQKVRMDQNIQQMNQNMAQNQMSGNIQNGSLESMQQMNRKAAEMNDEQKYAYSAAVSSLSQALGVWQSKKNFKKLCTSSFKKVLKEFEQEPAKVTAADCEKTIKLAVQNQASSVFANDGAKSAFRNEILRFAKEGIAAGLKSAELSKIANQLEDNKLPDDDGDVAMFDKCSVTPTDPSCLTPGTRTNNTTFQNGEFGAVDDSSNAFTDGHGSDSSFGEPGAATNMKENQKIADVNSPFVDQAHKANKILDEAAAATVRSTGGAGGGGGGGAGGGGAGGGASLGGDLHGASKDDNKDPSVKAGKFSANYSGGGAKFDAVKAGAKDEENPFSSLFDAKSAGGVEEDRSIASDIDGSASGLFQKISNRYGQVQADKRIQADLGQ